MTTQFIQSSPTLDAYWRAIILFGRNSASYKFALAKSLLELTSREKTFVTLDELAGPFARHLLEHLALSTRQGTSQSSRFLNTLSDYRRGGLTESQMLDRTAQLGFVNVIDAFHIVNQADVPVRFFVDERKSRSGISITDELLALKESPQFGSLPFEVEARWRLVETAWSLGIASPLLVVHYDLQDQSLYVQDAATTRLNVTSCVAALNGYQKGKCFYCFTDISVDACDVDHFFPFALATRSNFFATINIHGVWNLVLSCKDCNRGPNGKFARLPATRYLERLHRRNSYLIDSHHPLRETLILQTGAIEPLRRRFLQTADQQAIQSLIQRWSPPHELDPTF